MWCSSRCGYVVSLGRPFLGHRRILVISFLAIGLLHPLWYSFASSCFGCNMTLSYSLPLLLPKLCSSSRKTTSFFGFPHSPFITPIHLPHIIPSNPRLCDTHSLCTPEFYWEEFIFNIPFLQMIILIDNYRDNRKPTSRSIEELPFCIAVIFNFVDRTLCDISLQDILNEKFNNH